MNLLHEIGPHLSGLEQRLVMVEKDRRPGIGMYLTWVVATAAGAALGPTFGNVEAYGFGMAFPAVFLVMLKGMWKGVRAARPWLVSLVVASVTHLVLPGAWFVAAGAVTGLASAYVWAGR